MNTTQTPGLKTTELLPAPHPDPDSPGLRRIRALVDNPDAGVTAGDLGGWVHVTATLGEGVWVAEFAEVDSGAQIGAGAQIHTGAYIGVNAKIGAKAKILDAARVIEDARIGDGAYVGHSAHVRDGAYVGSRARIAPGANIGPGAYIGDQVRIGDSAKVRSGARIGAGSEIGADAYVGVNSEVGPDAFVDGRAQVGVGAVITERGHVMCLSGLPSGFVTLFRTRDGHGLTVGCWWGTTSTLRSLIARDEGWPDATGDEMAQRRPGLAALADMCDVYMSNWAWDDLATEEAGE